jgi:Pvc16 N-terminal domain
VPNLLRKVAVQSVGENLQTAEGVFALINRMVDDAVLFLRQHLSSALKSLSGAAPDDVADEPVVFVDDAKMDCVTFKPGAISLLLVNIEQETTLREPDLYSRISANGTRESVQPEIRMNLYVLFVAQFTQYEQSLKYLSRIVQHFQTHRVFDHQNAPELSERIDRLVLELITLPFSEQNEIWNALRTAYRPSVLYKARMIVFRDADALPLPGIAETILRATP